MAKGGKKGGNGGGGNDGGGSGDDGSTITGNRKDNVLNGTIFDDTILARRGDDVVNADDGNDFVMGEEGNDILNGDGGNDRLFGGSGNDSLNGGADNDELFGDLGDDELSGGDGHDFLVGGYGSDTLDGGAGIDTASFEDIGGDYVYTDGPDGPVIYEGITLTSQYDAGTGQTVYTVVNRLDETTSETDTLNGIERVFGSNFDDVMLGFETDQTEASGDDHFSGLQGNDIINGGKGDDTIFGGLDNDILTGGDGADTFVFLRRADGFVADETTPPEDLPLYQDAGVGDGYDIITDFDPLLDELLFLSNEEFDLSKFSAEYDAGTGNTVVTYQAEPDFFGPSVIVLEGVNVTLDDLIDPLDPDQNLQVSPDFDFVF